MNRGHAIVHTLGIASLIAMLVMMASITLPSLITRMTQPAFSFGDRVVVVDGFYKGLVGRVTQMSTYDTRRYQIDFENMPNSYDYAFVDESDLELAQ